MTNMGSTDTARRDLVWNAVLIALHDSPASIKLPDVRVNLDGDVSDRTIQRTMSAMRSLEWLRKDKESGHYWFPGPKAIKYLRGFDEDTEARVEKYIEDQTNAREDRNDQDTTNTGDSSDGSKTRSGKGNLVDPADNNPASGNGIGSFLSRHRVSGSGKVAEERREAIRQCLGYIRENGTASPSEIKNQFFDEYSGAYQNSRSWYKNCIYPAFKESDLVESGGEGSHTWSWVG